MAEDNDLRFFEGLIGSIIKGIVNRPEDVVVECNEDQHGVLATIHVNPADFGYAVGRKGATIMAVRTLCRSFGAKRKCHLSVKVYDPNPKPYDGIQDAAQ